LVYSGVATGPGANATAAAAAAAAVTTTTPTPTAPLPRTPLSPSPMKTPPAAAVSPIQVAQSYTMTHNISCSAERVVFTVKVKQHQSDSFPAW